VKGSIRNDLGFFAWATRAMVCSIYTEKCAQRAPDIFQSTAAENALRNLMSVNAVTNDITVVSLVNVSDVKQKIEDAFKRHSVLDSKGIEVGSGHGIHARRFVVTLAGHSKRRV